MSQETSSGPNSVIRITKSDADSQHVSDLIKRQASLRGEGGITRDTGRKWYYQNWFVLMIAGLVSAVLGWALLRPIMSDRPYIQGPIKSIEFGENGRTVARLKIGEHYYYVIPESREKIDGKWDKLDLDTLHKGDTVGLYVHQSNRDAKTLDEAMFFATHIIIDPPAAGGTDNLEAALRTQRLGFMLFFPLIAGMVGLGIGAADGLMCRLFRRVFLAGLIGLGVGLVGGFISGLFADLIYAPISEMALHHAGGSGTLGLTTQGLLLQLVARSLGWAVAGITMGLGQGLALRSGKIIIYGLLGGVIGGLLGGLLFDPIELFLHSANDPNVHLSRLVSIGVLGMCVGAMIGVVELLARDAWLRMAAGPLAGKEFLIFKNIMNVGASPKSDIYLFNDPGVAPRHATIRATGDLYEIECVSDTHMVSVNGRAVTRQRLRHGDQIGLGRTVFVFQRKTG